MQDLKLARVQGRNVWLIQSGAITLASSTNFANAYWVAYREWPDRETTRRYGPHAVLQNAVTGAILRGEGEAIAGIPA